MPRLARTLLLLFSATLLLVGLSMLYSTSYASHGEAFLRKQLEWIALGGIAAVLICWKFDDVFLRKYSWWLMGLVALPLAYLAVANTLDHFPSTRALARAMPLVGGLTVGSARWIRLGPVSLQPSELAKPIIILFLSGYMPRHARHSRQFWKGFFKPLLAVGLLDAMVLAGGDLSSSVITGCIVFVGVFVGGMRLRFLVPLVVAGCLLALAAIKASPERMARISSYRDPEACQQEEGYQLWHSQLALGSGGWRGLGFTNSRMKRQYLPEAHTDFIVAIIGEELGFVRVATLVALYVGLTACAFWLAVLAFDCEGVILSACIATTFGLQSFINIAVVSGFAPTTGVTAPFLSYGGSSMIVSLVMIGLLLSCSVRSERAEIQKAVDLQLGQRRQKPAHHSRLTPPRSQNSAP